MSNFILTNTQQKTELPFSSVKSVIKLLDEDATVPFIARYRQEITGGMDEQQIRLIQQWNSYFDTLEKRKETVLSTIKEQGKLSPELQKKIIECIEAAQLEELYLPYKPRRKTKASTAIENGLEPLADKILKNEPGNNKEAIIASFINANVPTKADVIEGALYIIAERFSLDLDIRDFVRRNMQRKGIMQARKKKAGADHKDAMKFELYYEFNQPLEHIKPHQVLALNRGENFNILSVGIELEEKESLDFIERRVRLNSRGMFVEEMLEAIKLSVHRYIFPSIELEFRNSLTEIADKHAITSFATNLKNLLMQSPVAGKVVLGVDPGFVSGCKVAVVDAFGNYLEGDVIYPVQPKMNIKGSEEIMNRLINQYKVDIIAIGNGTASRETELFVASLIKKFNHSVSYLIVSEAGASVYSASEVARQEFPKLDATQRGNISIARRLQDPLAELVKIDPKSIGVGLYQHDVDQKALADELSTVVESCVNHVGVELNSASYSLLSYVSGISEKMAQEIVKHRQKIKKFNSRKELMDVAGIGAKTFEQSAGFLKLRDSANPLDNTTIHPESYEAVEKMVAFFGLSSSNLKELAARLQAIQPNQLPQLLENAGIGKPTLELIKMNLLKPGRDPREELPKPLLRSDVLKIGDLQEGMRLIGTVRNVVDFGAFVDIGLKNDALVHISKMGSRFVKNPHEVLAVGEIIHVQVDKVELEKQRVGLSLLS